MAKWPLWGGSKLPPKKATRLPVAGGSPGSFAPSLMDSMVPRASCSGSIRKTTMRYLIALMALAGVVVSTLALRVHYSTETEPCSIDAKWDCGIVNHSPFAEIAHVPVAAIGIVGYLGLAGLALARRRLLLTAAAAVGLAFALYLSHIERDILEVWCLYCVISLGIIALVTVLSLGWLAAWEVKKRRAQTLA